MTAYPNPTALAQALREEIYHQAEAIADTRSVTTRQALRDIYEGGGPCGDSIYCGAPEECSDDALEGVFYTGYHLLAALRCGVSWPVARQTTASARKLFR
jgi:hypothetical protein